MREGPPADAVVLFHPTSWLHGLGVFFSSAPPIDGSRHLSLAASHAESASVCRRRARKFREQCVRASATRSGRKSRAAPWRGERFRAHLRGDAASATSRSLARRLTSSGDAARFVGRGGSGAGTGAAIREHLLDAPGAGPQSQRARPPFSLDSQSRFNRAVPRGMGRASAGFLARPRPAVHFERSAMLPLPARRRLGPRPERIREAHGIARATKQAATQH